LNRALRILRRALGGLQAMGAREIEIAVKYTF
jgi:hypothetical protein